MFNGTSQGLTFCCYRLFLVLHLTGPTAKRLVPLIFIVSTEWPRNVGELEEAGLPLTKRPKTNLVRSLFVLNVV